MRCGSPTSAQALSDSVQLRFSLLFFATQLNKVSCPKCPVAEVELRGSRVVSPYVYIFIYRILCGPLAMQKVYKLV